MTTNQPKWICIGTVGDIDPIEYSGGFVLIDKTGVYDPEVEYIEPMLDPFVGYNGAEGTIAVYRFSIDQCFWDGSVLSNNEYYKDSRAWFADYIDTIDNPDDRDNWINCICSDDPYCRAMAYMDLFYYYGAENFDSYPIAFTPREAKKRYSGAMYKVRQYGS